MVGPPPWFALPQSTHLAYCDLPAETCCLARPVPLRFIGIWRLLTEMCSGREATATSTPPETQVLSRIGGDNLLACCPVYPPARAETVPLEGGEREFSPFGS
jgi:hypothetical protein